MAVDVLLLYGIAWAASQTRPMFKPRLLYSLHAHTWRPTAFFPISWEIKICLHNKECLLVLNMFNPEIYFNATMWLLMFKHVILEDSQKFLAERSIGNLMTSSNGILVLTESWKKGIIKNNNTCTIYNNIIMYSFVVMPCFQDICWSLVLILKRSHISFEAAWVCTGCNFSYPLPYPMDKNVTLNN